MQQSVFIAWKPGYTAVFFHSLMETCELVLQDVPSFLCLFVCRSYFSDPITVTDGWGQDSFSFQSMEERDYSDPRIFHFFSTDLQLLNQCLLAV